MNPLDSITALTNTVAQSTVNTPLPLGNNTISEGYNYSNFSNLNPTLPTALPQTDYSGPTNWGHMVQQMVMDVNQKQQVAGAKVADVLNGGTTPVHEAVIASQEASLSFTFLSEVRNKVVESYQEIMRMQI